MASMPDASNRDSAAALLLAGSCFFLTGVSALVYEICWIRKASLTFGSDTWAISAVVAVFFAGLALGSYIVGRYSSRTTRPLRLFGLLELGVGLTAIASPTLFSITDAFYGTFYPYILHSVPLLAFTRLVMVAIVILPATTLMGGSLPLFCRQFVRHNRRVARGVGLLYGLNTFGAVVGSALCGFWLIPHIGVNSSIYLAGVLNLIVGVTAIRLALRVTTDPCREEIEAVANDGPTDGNAVMPQRPSPAILTSLFFGVGFVAVANEVLWTRYLSLWMPNTVYTYTLTLTVVLLGIVLGSLLAAVFSDRVRWRAGLFGAAQVGSGLAVMTVMQMRPAWLGDWLSPVSAGQQLGVIALVMLVPAILSGLSFPLAIGLIVRDASQTGAVAGRLAAVNICGGIIGSLLVGFVALPLLGIQTTLFLITGVSLLLGIVAWWRLEQGPSWLLRASWAAASVLLWLAIPWFCRTELPRDFLATEGGTLVDYREGLSANVSVVRHAGTLRLEINRMWQGQDRKNHQVMAAHIPTLLHPDPKSVLVVGLGTGQTARSFLAHDIDQLDCLEIEDGLVDLVAKYFDGAWLADPRVRVIVEDGRNYVTHTKQRYDLISIEVGQVYRPGVASFYTVDFYQRLRSRLRPDGLVCQFLPIEFFGPNEVRTLLATFLRVFPESVLWYNTSELLLVGTEGKQITLNTQRWQARVAGNPRLRQDLEYAYWGGPAYDLSHLNVFLAGFLCGPEQLHELAAGGAIYRDDRPYLEYLSLLGRGSAPEIVTLIHRHLSPMASIIKSADDPVPSGSRRIRKQNLQSIVARIAVNRGKMLEAAGRPREAILAYQWAVAEMPDYPDANFRLAVMLQSQGRHQEAVTLFGRVLATKPDYFQALQLDSLAADVHVRLGWTLAAAGRLEQATEHFQEALRLQPDLARAHLGMGNVLLSSGNLDGAAEAFEQAATLDPNLVEAHTNLAFLMQSSGRFDDALMHLQKALQLAPKDPTSLAGAAWILATHPDASRRDPEQAIAWAEEAWQVTHQQDPQVADVLAAAYAAAGRFEQAVQLAEQALQMAETLKLDALADPIRKHLQLYRQGKPCVQ